MTVSRLSRPIVVLPSIFFLSACKVYIIHRKRWLLEYRAKMVALLTLAL